jgi:deazaflavin-dependent oxidoreductase (nitroreductase family)
MINPLARRLISAGLPTGAPNVLLVVRGRRSGRPRSVPVGMVALDGRWYVQASYGEAGWVGNLRAAGQATVIEHHREVSVGAVELTADEAGVVLQRLLGGFHRSRLLGALMGPDFRPPIGVLCRLHVRIDDTPADYVAEAGRHPIFELRPLTDTTP